MVWGISTPHMKPRKVWIAHHLCNSGPDECKRAPLARRHGHKLRLKTVQASDNKETRPDETGLH